MSHPSPEIVDPADLLTAENLELVAAHLVDGRTAGRNLSPLTGEGSEFHSHREYEPGDDLRRVNWRLWARTDRLYIREARAETNLGVHVLLDSSTSMRPGNGTMTKWRYAARVGATIALQASRALDAPSLTLFSDHIRSHLPPRGGRRHAHDLISEISAYYPDGRTDLGLALREAAPLLTRRGIVAVISDFMDWSPQVVPALAELRHQGHEVCLIQILDPLEQRLPESGAFVFYAGEEPGEERRVDGARAREAHAAAVDVWLGEIGAAAAVEGLTWLRATTERPVGELFAEWMDIRKSRRGIRG
jgi:uncharacterized protein (DUF58 family)